MSGNKKTASLLVFVILALVIGALFYFLMGKDGEKAADVTGQTTETMVEPSAESSNTTSAEASTSIPSGVDIGEEGRIYKLPENELLGVRGVGNPNAPIKIQEFFSLTCNHCANFHAGTYKQIKEKYIDTGRVYYVFQEFPLNGPALYGSMISRCLPQERYEDFITLLLDNQEDWAFGGDFRSSLQKNAALAGMGEEEFNACFDNEELRGAIGDNIDEAMGAWRIRSTPSFIFNDGKRILRGGKSIESFDAVIAMLESGETPPEPVDPMQPDPEPIVEEEAIEEPAEEAVETSSDAAETVEEAASEMVEEAEGVIEDASDVLGQ
ncbi:MAG: thioredoxin domain-containing protein [Pseudomonadota bacterium]